MSIWRTDEWCFYTALSHVSTGELATAALQNTLLDDVAVVKTSVDNGGNLSPTAATTLTLSANANGSVTPTQNVHVIDTNAAASAGDLATLAIAGNIRSGHLLLLSAANVAHVVTVKNGTGNISIDGGDFVLDATTRFILLQLVGTTWFKVASSAVGVAGAFGFRLTLSSNAPVPAGDVTGATTLYAAPYGMFAGWCTGYDASGNPTTVRSGQFSIAIPATSARVYSVFVYLNGTVPTLELAIWTNDSTPGTAAYSYSTTIGKMTKTGDLTRLFVGLVSTVSNNASDTYARRGCVNYYNRVARECRVVGLGCGRIQ